LENRVTTFLNALRAAAGTRRVCPKASDLDRLPRARPGVESLESRDLPGTSLSLLAALYLSGWSAPLFNDLLGDLRHWGVMTVRDGTYREFAARLAVEGHHGGLPHVSALSWLSALSFPHSVSDVRQHHEPAARAATASDTGDPW